MATPAADAILWRPHPGPQTRALASTAFELLYGGEAGSGKSEFLLAGPLRWVHCPEFQAVLFRRTFPELERSLIPRSWRFYKPLGADYHQTKHVWTFPSGAQIWLSHLQYDANVHDHQGPEYQFVGFDELPSFTLFQYRYLISRMRSTAGIPIRLRATCNPEPGWVRDRFAPWVRTSPEYTGPRVKSGAILHYEYDTNTETETLVPERTELSLTRQFIRARRTDNPALALKDPEYEKRLNVLDPVQRRRLKEGDWEAEYAAGLMFQRQWFPMRDRLPLGCNLVRFWDRAATEEKLESKRALQPEAKNDPDWTVGTLYARDRQGLFWVVDVVRFRGKPGDVTTGIKTAAERDDELYGKGAVIIILEQEPGASGVSDIANLRKELAEWHVVAVAHSTKKLVRAGPVSGQAQGGHVHVIKGPWNEPWFSELEAFPKGKHDDQVDSLSGAHNFLSSVSMSTAGGASGQRQAVNSGGY